MLLLRALFYGQITKLTKTSSCNSYPNVGAGDKPPAKGNDGTYVESIPVEPGEKLYVLKPLVSRLRLY